jgi:C-terminal processing protease CtpA/Prc
MAQTPSYETASLSDLIAASDDSVRAVLIAAKGLRDYLGGIDKLNENEQRTIVEQAIVLLEAFYVHLPLKRAMHGIDPLQRLRLLRRRVPQLPSEIAFHHEMTEVFTSLRDLHTNYILPLHFARMAAFLPFRVERCFDAGATKYLVSQITPGFSHPTFVRGVEITYWNGVPIARAVEIAASYHAGSNREARHARGVAGLTVRAMNISPPPDEEWVVIGYTDLTGQHREFRADWTITVLPEDSAEATLALGDPAAAAYGLDLEGDTIQRVNKMLFAQHVAAAKRRIRDARDKAIQAAAASGADPEAAAVAGVSAEVQGLNSTMPDVFTARIINAQGRPWGHIRIRTFSVPPGMNDSSCVNEFVRLLERPELPKDGLVLDVRGNGGGLIWFAERLLQLLTPRTIEPCRLQFIYSALTLELCRREPTLRQWVPSLERALETGATFSAAFPLTSPERCNDIGQRYYGPVVLVTDARCYSATDIFAAGFQDHRIGKILGVDGNTGAGGANVWTDGLIRHFFQGAQLQPPLTLPAPLPRGAGMRVAIRRTLRVGPEAGTELEDLGVIPDERHEITRNDLLFDDKDLLERAAAELARRQPACKFEVLAQRTGPTVTLDLTTQGVDRVDTYIGGIPKDSRDVTAGAIRFELTAPNPGRIDVRGYKGAELTCARSSFL